MYSEQLANSIINDLQKNLNKLKNPRTSVKSQEEWLYLKNWIEDDIKEIINHTHARLHKFKEVQS